MRRASGRWPGWSTACLSRRPIEEVMGKGVGSPLLYREVGLMAMRRRVLLWLAGVALVVGALLLTDRLLWQPGLTEGNVRRLRPGMPLAEVEALLGGPATWEMDLRQEAPGEKLGFRWLRKWVDEGARLEVQFFEDGRVMAAAGWGRPPAGPPARVRSWWGW